MELGLREVIGRWSAVVGQKLLSFGQRCAEDVQVDSRLVDISTQLSDLVLEIEPLGDVLDTAAGAFGSLILAYQLKYQDRKEELPREYYEKLSERTRKMAKGTLPPHGRWISGYYFNSGLLRLAICREQIRAVLEGWNRERMRRGETALPNVTDRELDRVHCEARKLRHEPMRLHYGRDVTFDEAVAAFNEFIEVLKKARTELCSLPKRLVERPSAPR